MCYIQKLTVLIKGSDAQSGDLEILGVILTISQTKTKVNNKNLPFKQWGWSNAEGIVRTLRFEWVMHGDNKPELYFTQKFHIIYSM